MLYIQYSTLRYRKSLNKDRLSSSPSLHSRRNQDINIRVYCTVFLVISAILSKLPILHSNMCPSKFMHYKSTALSARLPLLSRISRSPTFSINLPPFHYNISPVFSPAFSIQSPVFSRFFNQISRLLPLFGPPLDPPNLH